MHVAIDARLFAYQPAGIGYYAKRLAEALAGLARPLRLSVLESRRQVGPVVEQRSVRVKRLWTPPHHRYEQLGLAVELLAESIDLLHSPDFIPPFYRRCRSVVTVHDLAFIRYPHLLTAESRRYYGQVERAVRSADAVVAVSRSTGDDLLRFFGIAARKIAVIPEAADPFFQPRPAGDRTPAPGLPSGAPYVLFVGTLEPRKNLPTLLKAFQRLRASGRSERLVLAGRPGWLAGDLAGLVQSLGLADAVHFTGPISIEDLRALYWHAGALALPSFHEGFGLPAVEAMACGTPVVASRAGALPEVVGDAGLLVDPADAIGLAEALGRVLEDRHLRDALRQRGFSQAGSFSWERTALETYDLYARVMAG
ncbi:MAG: glycosyltransferase family 4 protein [Chloroflexi bacterium]|nr:glycosyltransferase family 4 protein [Chloroflexota bacterium]